MIGQGPLPAPETRGVVPIVIDLEEAALAGDLGVPAGATGVVLFVHGSGSSRHSPRNRFVAERLREAGLGTLLLDLLTGDEELIDERTRTLRFDIDLLARRVVGAAAWLTSAARTRHRSVGCFGASTGATHLFEEAGTLEEVADVAARWFARHLGNRQGS